MNTVILSTLRAHGGIARRSEFITAGATDRDIRLDWAAASILRVRNGVYALPTVHPEILRAVRVGGVLAAGSAAAHHGLWVPPGGKLHVSIRPNANGLRDPDDAGIRLDRDRTNVALLHDGHRLDAARERNVVLPRTCILQTIRRVDEPAALAVLDSAIRKYGLNETELEAMRAEVPSRLSRLLDVAEGSAESGTESAMRLGLLDLGLRFEAQRWLTDEIRVDFLVSGRLVVECVSFEYHASPHDYEKDRRRIAEIVRLGYVVLEFTYHQVFSGWAQVRETLLCALSRG
ncbi:hypothetical protein AX769_19145 [Frondihabitans sp. PAMC 28766]|uniref:endonuclease domain-containing protein n=1 Tax=Frondihabitans sp. PAMC 28766 TaxID=1795630 RepID=UPI00078BDEE9|nr:DUF559 domain-containing protein [Frondihabitans sp. PAMC 28766]AMM21877.1 hypothetical protein AX769_19145 [Frondihabitans sp. PAMC 28766]